jgi:membrane protein YdbS with pleckstrin-like domain
MREFFKRLATSWPTRWGAVVTVVLAVYTMGVTFGWWNIPQADIEQYIAAVGIVLAALINLFANTNDPTNPTGF